MFADIDILVLLADLEELVEIGHHQLDQLGIEVLSLLLFDESQHLFQRPCLLVAAIRPQRIEHIGQRNDTPLQRDIRPFQATWIAAAIPLFMVIARYGGADLEQCQVAAGEHVLSQLGMGFHYFPLFRSELARLVQDGIGDADLADVVQR